jgi:choice-of-anchor C domain-containing protein
MKLKVLLPLFAVSAALASAAAFTNGGFESSTCDPAAGSYNTQSSGSTCIAGWTVGNNGLDYINGYWVASEGTHSLDMNGSGGVGSIQQSFDVNNGHTYQVSFDLSGNPGDQGVKSMDVNVGGGTSSFTFDSAGTSTANMGWVTHSFTFDTGLSSSETLQFLSTTNNCCFGPALDNVVVVDLGRTGSGVPEPSAFVLLGSALVGLGFLRRRK